MLRENIILNNNDNLNIREFRKKFFEMPWHSHGEYELVYIISGSGKKFISDSMKTFHENDFTLIGPNIPHFFLADDLYYQNNDAYCHWWVIQFSKDIFPSIIDELEAFSPISSLLASSQYGVDFSGIKSKKQILNTIINMEEMSGIDRIITLYKLLNFLSREHPFEILNPEKTEVSSEKTDDIINTVYRYLLNNFKENIQLEDLAALTCMRVTTLCSYYKRHTLKTIINTLNEIRLNYACKLIVNTKLDINQIAYESGFRNISNFNRQFLNFKKSTPNNYRRLYTKITQMEEEAAPLKVGYQIKQQCHQ